MPIRPENKARYPKEWPAIRSHILKRAENKCEFCGVRNHAQGFRSPVSGHFYEMAAEHVLAHGLKPLKIILTIAHLDHIPENCGDDNLKALCQKCHNGFDAYERAKGRKERARPAGD
jgi:hypothetical protein